LVDIDWVILGLLTGTVLLCALYGLTASGHFPTEHRAARLRGPVGGLVLWATMAAAGLAALAALVLGWQALPWYATVIGAGTALLFTPLLLRPLPDSFVNGRRGLVAFAAGAALLATLMWRAS
jgi:hypothetical protein